MAEATRAGGHCFTDDHAGEQTRASLGPMVVHMLLSVARDAGPVLVHPHERRIDHLHRRIVSCGQPIHDLVPDASLPPANEAIVASRMRSVALR
jgi:hypothetical protein